MLILWLESGLVIWIFVTLVWLLSLFKQDAGIMDIFWGVGFVTVTSFCFFRLDIFSTRAILLFSLVCIWGIRLALHIGIRNWGKPEDFRYHAWRIKAGNSFWWYSYFKVFLLQGAVMWIVCLPLIAVLHFQTPTRVTVFDVAGVLLWLIGFLFEAIGDWQLLQFKKNPNNKGKVLDSGLWRYTRHPNYFGEAVLWWGFYLIACSTGSFWTIISPLLMTFLLLKVSGVAMLEDSLKETKPQYATYIQKTSAFIPRLPKSI